MKSIKTAKAVIHSKFLGSKPINQKIHYGLDYQLGRLSLHKFFMGMNTHQNAKAKQQYNHGGTTITYER